MIEYYNVWLAVSAVIRQAKAELTESREAKLGGAQAASGGTLTDEDLVALARQARETWGKM